ncbi:Alpha-1,3-mannosyltransferase-like protein [Polyrhizophydium stewartii]|uniref:Alpha-1,3/1,6-mannosyltransferase ALG2 n=1 Tax=Polyrhizophydium stewartii TaxID=2732419 RepID=A0ABR4NJY5_9FUNG
MATRRAKASTSKAAETDAARAAAAVGVATTGAGGDSGKLRVAFVHPDLGIGGAERLVVDAAMGLQARGHTVTIFTSHHDRTHCFEETRDGRLDVRVYGDWLPRSIAGKGHMVFAILRSLYLSAMMLLLWPKSYDVLFVDQISATIPVLRGLKAKASRCGVADLVLHARALGLTLQYAGYCGQVLFYCHFPDKLLTRRDSLAKSLYRMPIDSLEELTTNMADDIVVNSAFTASVFADAFKSAKIRPEVLYPGIRLDSYPNDIDRSDEGVKLIASNKTTIVSINRFERKKNIGLAIEAFVQLRTLAAKQFDGLRLVIAGGYDSRVAENVEHLGELVALAQRHGLSTHIAGARSVAGSKHVEMSAAQVVFVPSFSEAQRTYLLRSSLCLVYTPSHEHFGIVPVEAMYAQLPVVAVSSGGPVESIVHGETGYLCEGNAGAFGRQLAELVAAGGSDRRAKMGAKARARVVERFSLDAFSERLEALLQRVRDGGGRNGSHAEWLFWSFWIVTSSALALAVAGGVLAADRLAGR